MRKGVIHLLMLGLVVALALPAIACQQEEPAEIEMEIDMEEMGDDMEESMEEMGDDMEDAAEEIEEGAEEMMEDEPPPPAS